MVLILACPAMMWVWSVKIEDNMHLLSPLTSAVWWLQLALSSEMKLSTIDVISAIIEFSRRWRFSVNLRRNNTSVSAELSEVAFMEWVWAHSIKQRKELSDFCPAVGYDIRVPASMRYINSIALPNNFVQGIALMMPEREGHSAVAETLLGGRANFEATANASLRCWVVSCLP